MSQTSKLRLDFNVRRQLLANAWSPFLNSKEWRSTTYSTLCSWNSLVLCTTLHHVTRNVMFGVIDCLHHLLRCIAYHVTVLRTVWAPAPAESLQSHEAGYTKGPTRSNPDFHQGSGANAPEVGTNGIPGCAKPKPTEAVCTGPWPIPIPNFKGLLDDVGTPFKDKPKAINQW